MQQKYMLTIAFQAQSQFCLVDFKNCISPGLKHIYTTVQKFMLRKIF